MPFWYGLLPSLFSRMHCMSSPLWCFACPDCFRRFKSSWTGIEHRQKYTHVCDVLHASCCCCYCLLITFEVENIPFLRPAHTVFKICNANWEATLSDWTGCSGLAAKTWTKMKKTLARMTNDFGKYKQGFFPFYFTPMVWCECLVKLRGGKNSLYNQIEHSN